MNALIENLTSQLGVTPDQAKGGIGLIANMAKDKLGGDFSQLSDKFPELSGMMSAAPAAGASEGAAGGLGGMMGTAMSALGVGGDLGALASLAGGFKSLGLDAGMVSKFAPIVTNYLSENGGDTVKALLAKAMS